jgi:hypothetical protein
MNRTASLCKIDRPFLDHLKIYDAGDPTDWSIRVDQRKDRITTPQSGCARARLTRGVSSHVLNETGLG